MNHQRLHALSDGIFAIAMTLLVFDIRVPVLKVVNSHNLLVSLRSLLPIFLSYILSFAILYTYWQGHTYIISHLAKSIDSTLSNANALFLFFVVLIPFSSELLGLYHNTEIGILFYGLNVMALSAALLLMRRYILSATTIESREQTRGEQQAVFIRASFPSLCALIAIIIGIVNKDIPIVLFTMGVLFNFTRLSTRMISRLID